MITGYRIDQARLAALKDAVELTSWDFDKELAAAVNATSRHAISLVAKSITTEIRVAQRDVKKVLKKGRRASRDYPNTFVELLESERLPLKYFKPRQLKKGLSYKISKKKGGTTKIADAFIVTRFGGHVFRRVGERRAPIYKPMGPSPWGVFVKQKKLAEVQKQVEQRLLEEVDDRIRLNKLRSDGVIR